MRRDSRFWWRWLAATAALYGTAWVLLTVLDTGPRPGRLLLLTVLVTAVVALVDVGFVSAGPDWSVVSAQPIAPPGQDTRLGMYTRVISGHLDSRVPDAGLRDRLAELADARLRQHHGLGLRDRQASTVLGAELSGILTGPVRRLSRAEIDQCVRRIEEI